MSLQTSSLLSKAHGFHQAGQVDQAEAVYLKILQRDPAQVDALQGLVALAHQTGRYEIAVNMFSNAVEACPGNATLYFGLALLLINRGDNNVAAKTLQKVLSIEPRHVGALCSLGGLCRDFGKFNHAIECFQRAVAIQPDNLHALSNLGNALWQLGKYDEAVNCFLKIVGLTPEDANAHINLGTALYDQGKFELAIKHYQKAIDISGSDGIRIRLATALPKIMMSCEQIDEFRNRIDNNITSLMAQELQVRDPLKEIGYTNFYLTYHGKNNRDLHCRLALLYLHACPSLTYTAPHCSTGNPSNADTRIKIGFISKNLTNKHSISKISRGIISHLSRDHFTIVVLVAPSPIDNTDALVLQHADEVVNLPNDLKLARETIAEQRLDILFYQDIGIDAFTYFLAFARLAPIQCTYFGHPDTTGIPNMDYYISTEDWESDNTVDQYSESLVKLKDVTSVSYYYKPSIPDTLKPRNYFGFDESTHIYLSPVTLFKFHPDFDELLAGILRADRDGHVVLIKGTHPHWAELLRNRFLETIPDVVDRIQFLPLQSGGDFLNLIAVSDVMLDTIHFCSFNTVLEAFAVGTPVVTLPGKFMRSRYTLSLYRKMQLEDGIARDKEDYVNIAVRLGTEPGYRAQVRQHILETSDRLWEEMEIIREFERIFTKMHTR